MRCAIPIDGNFIPIFAIAVGFVITITAILTDHITRYKLKVAQIQADALVRAEEVRTRNQLELEKLMGRIKVVQIIAMQIMEKLLKFMMIPTI